MCVFLCLYASEAYRTGHSGFTATWAHGFGQRRQVPSKEQPDQSTLCLHVAPNRRTCMDVHLQCLKMLRHHLHAASGGAARMCRPGRAAEASRHRYKPLFCLGGVGNYCRKNATPARASLWTRGQDKRMTRLHCENAVFIVKIRSRIKGACMNHKHLHAINVRTKDSEGQSWGNVFSHEKQCFELQCIFDFVSSI